jgi:hypothetical protein
MNLEGDDHGISEVLQESIYRRVFQVHSISFCAMPQVHLAGGLDKKEQRQRQPQILRLAALAQNDSHPSWLRMTIHF